ncbi:hypothetical protein ACFFNY_03645 [Paenibacillus hodogayensis]|uniref:Uncharacterized protein n=1 Tax=Paenibacillus hodogayensis TaxID=279208 RepID=A0ABV5VQW5_9BACL
MIRYTKHLFILILSIFIVILILTSLPQNNTILSKEDREFYRSGPVNFILQSQNIDKSYPLLSTEIDAVYDIYNLYYLKQIKDRLNTPIKSDELEDTYNFIVNNKENILFPEKRNDNISTLYFFTSIFKDYIEKDIETKEEIIHYILELKLPNGSFSYSKNNIEEILANEKTQYLSTYMAVFVLRDLGYLTPINETNEWVKVKLSKLDKYNYTTTGHLFLALQTAKLLNVEFDEPKIIEKLENMASEIARFTNNDDALLLLVIDPLIDFKNIYPQANINLNIYKEKIEKLQLDNGFFKIDSQSEENILATFIALKYFDTIHFSLKTKREELLSKIEKYKLSPYYLYYQKKPGTLEATYFSNKIKNLVNPNDKTNYDSFLSKINANELGSAQMFYYLSLNQASFDKERIKQLVISHLEKNISNKSYMEIHYNILSLKILDQPLPDDKLIAISNMITTNLSNQNLSSPESAPYLAFYRLLLSEAIGQPYESSQQDKNFLKTIFENPTNLYESNYSVEFYFLFYELLIKYFKDLKTTQLEKLIEESRNEYGFVRTGIGDPSSTSYGLTFKTLYYFGK